MKMRIAIALLLSMLLPACGWFGLQEETEQLPSAFNISTAKQGYSYVLGKAKTWTTDPSLESVYSTYRRSNGQWRLTRVHYVFIDEKKEKYQGLTIDLIQHQLVIGPSGQITEKGGITTKAIFDLSSSPTDELSALQRAETFLNQQGTSEQCIPSEVTVSGHGDVRPVWWVNCRNPIANSPLFLATLYVDAINGDIQQGPINNSIDCNP